MIFVDSNVPMYLVGKEHPHKLEAQSMVERAVSAGEYLLSDAEVLQEICHRYKALRRLDMIQQGFDALLGLVEEVLPIEQTDVEAARDIVLRYDSLATRDAVHVAVMQRHGIERIMTFDRGFDAHPAVERLS